MTASHTADQSVDLPSSGNQQRITPPTKIQGAFALPTKSAMTSDLKAATANKTGDGTEDIQVRPLTGKAIKRNYIIFSCKDEEPILIPRTACHTWEHLLDALRDAFYRNEKSIKALEKGKFILDHKHGIISPKHWENLVDDISILKINLNCLGPEDSDSGSSSGGDDDDDDDDDDDGGGEHDGERNPENKESKTCDPQYELTTEYVYDYLQKDGDDADFLFTKRFDQPAKFERVQKLGSSPLPVLELRTEVVLASFHNRAAIGEHKKSKRMKPLDPKDRIQDSELKIRSPYLLNVLRAVITHHSGESDLDQGCFDEPYIDLLQHKKSLLEYKQLDSKLRLRHDEFFNKRCDEHIDYLVEYLSSISSIGLKQAEVVFEEQSLPTTTFSALKLLLKPGVDVYVSENGILNAYVLECLEGGVKQVRNVETASPYIATVWGLVSDGLVIKRRSKRIELPVFDSGKPVTILPVFPVIYQDQLGNGKRREELITRGKLYFESMKKPAFMEFTGVGCRKDRKKYHHARVVIDHRSRPWAMAALEDLGVDLDSSCQEDRLKGDCAKPDKFARIAQCECDSCTKTLKGQNGRQQMLFHGYDEIDPNDPSQHSSHRYLICAQHAFGFVLKDREYDFLDISCLEKPRIAEDAIDQLVMDSNTKETIKALVKTYTEASISNTKFTRDFIQGKGEGQIILLHGGPGTGKTLTAESVAEFTRRPLLSISAADLGHQPEDVEENLVKFFKDAHDWDAIVLLDEADVYLSSRSMFDLHRNSIVSVFLRSLDYFQGILFLTTSRIGEFDEAIKSRIHLSIGYKNLDQDARKQIWTNLFSQLKSDGARNNFNVICSYEAKDYVKKSEKLESLKWNGREIRNAFQTATALAVYDARHRDEKEGNDKGTTTPVITEDHIEKVVEMGAAFSSYLFNTRGGMTEEQIKDREKLRFNEGDEVKVRTGRYTRPEK